MTKELYFGRPDLLLCLCIYLSRNADGRCHNTENLLKYDNVKITSSKLAMPNCNEMKYTLNYNDQKLKKTTVKNRGVWRSNVLTNTYKVLHFVLI